MSERRKQSTNKGSEAEMSDEDDNFTDISDSEDEWMPPKRHYDCSDDSSNSDK